MRNGAPSRDVVSRSLHPQLRRARLEGRFEIVGDCSHAGTVVAATGSITPLQRNRGSAGDPRPGTQLRGDLQSAVSIDSRCSTVVLFVPIRPVLDHFNVTIENN